MLKGRRVPFNSGSRL